QFALVSTSGYSDGDHRRTCPDLSLACISRNHPFAWVVPDRQWHFPGLRSDRCARGSIFLDGVALSRTGNRHWRIAAAPHRRGSAGLQRAVPYLFHDRRYGEGHFRVHHQTLSELGLGSRQRPSRDRVCGLSLGQSFDGFRLDARRLAWGAAARRRDSTHLPSLARSPGDLKRRQQRPGGGFFLRCPLGLVRGHRDHGKGAFPLTCVRVAASRSYEGVNDYCRCPRGRRHLFLAITSSVTSMYAKPPPPSCSVSYAAFSRPQAPFTISG